MRVRLIRVKHWMLIWLSWKAMRQNLKSRIQAAVRGIISHVVDVDIRLVNDQMPFTEVQLIAQHNVLTNVQQHTKKSEPIYDTYMLEKIDSNTTPDSTNMCHRGEEIDQDAEQYQVKSPLLNAKFFKMKDMVKKEVYNELSNKCLQLEEHCISLEISIQQKEKSFQSNKPCKNQDALEFCELFEINDLKDQLWAKTKKSTPAKSHHVNSPSSSRNSQKDSYGSNDIAHNYFLEEARKKTQDRNRNLKPRWKLTGRVFKTIDLRWIPTGKIFTSSTTKVGNELPNGSNEDITNPYECEENLYVSASICFTLKKGRLRVSLQKRLISQKPSV
uniref:Uncharacterized protein n=1 Tax=Tanacetum cinerariifolium TaxID=118510 RepID=A0A6L2MQ36_TANCI|nr:hypothetical protein [Tanacetum cinerariifolium]